MRWIILPFMFLIFITPLVQGAYSVQIRLSLNNTENTVYIPGNSTSDSGTWLSESIFTSPTHNYIASYNNTNILSAMISAAGQTHSVLVNGTGTNHSIGLNMSVINSRALLAFTSGDWKTVEDDISNIENGAFFTFIQPSFSYGIGLYVPLKIMLEYTNLNITNNDLFHLGRLRLMIENRGIVLNKTTIDVSEI